MSTVLFWFRHDLRLHDQPALHQAAAAAQDGLLPVACLPDTEATTPWGFARWGRHRTAWWRATLQNLQQQLRTLGCPLLVCRGPATHALPQLAQAVNASTLVCEDIAAPEEQAEVAALRASGLKVQTVWQSSLLDPYQLPWPVSQLPGVFTPFRQAVESRLASQASQGVPTLLPTARPAPKHLPPWPPAARALADQTELAHTGNGAGTQVPADPRSSFPYGQPGFEGGETAALAHLRRYLASDAPADYKRTRNRLTGVSDSSKWSPWLATGALSARRALAELKQHEAARGASDGSYWLWFELLWRDYFRLLHLQHGRALYRAGGLSRLGTPAHDTPRFQAWCQGRTGEPLVDAAMRELATTGYLSNRLRQVAASYLVHDLACDWRAGAAWFESQLLDYDVYSNQGNWLYIAGRGTDPRGGRRFNPAKQAAEHDPEGAYQRLWAAA